jgi:hypothetical protein
MSEEQIGRLHSQLLVYARSVHISELSDEKPDELRIWMKDYIFGTVLGYTIADGLVKKCSIPVHGAADATATQMGRCTRHKLQHNSHFVAPLSELQTFDRRSVECGVEDGSGIDVEGVVAGHWFAFHADNPDSCGDTASVLVSKIVKDIS